MDTPQSSLLADRFKGYLGANRWLLFLALSLGYVLDIALRQYVLVDDQLYYATYGAQVALEEIASINKFRQDYGWIIFPVPILVMLFRAAFTAAALNIGAILFGTKVRFRDLFGVALSAELAFVVHNLLLTTLMITVARPETLDQMNTFAPFSLLGLFKLLGVTKIQIFFVYPLQVLSLFEVIYWVILALGMSRLYRYSFGKAFRTVMTSYGVSLVLWIVTVIFLLVLVNLGKS